MGIETLVLEARRILPGPAADALLDAARAANECEDAPSATSQRPLRDAPHRTALQLALEDLRRMLR